MIHVIPLSRPQFGSEELYAVKKVLASGWVAGGGPEGSEFSRKVAEYAGVRFAHPIINCTAGIHVSLLACGVGEGDEVLVPDFTYPATAHAVMYVGAKPVFVDADPKTYNISIEDAKTKLSIKTRAVIPVHLFGQPADMDAVMKFARGNNLSVIEDAACALGAEYRG